MEDNFWEKNRLERHAVVLIGYDDHYLKFLNSYGEGWGDEGFFRIEDETLLEDIKFYDVFWEESDLF
jgi:C1A family cysteine protease